MSSPWSPPDLPASESQGAPALTLADLALPIVIGGVLPAAIGVGSVFLGLTVFAAPVAMVCTGVGGALAGANVSRRRDGPLGWWAATATGGALAALQVVPCAPFAAALLLVPGPDASYARLAAALIVAGAIGLVACGSGGAVVGHLSARGGALGSIWTGPRASP